MAANSNGSTIDSDSHEEQLKDVFVKTWNLFDELENSTLANNSLEFQGKVKTAMEKLELATSIVNSAGIFSTNELIDEVSTESLQYMLLPFFLGKLTLKLHREDRLEVLNVAEVYFKDFLQRSEEYDLYTPAHKKQNVNSEISETTPSNEMAQLMQAAHNRNDKIAQFRKKKELEERIKELKGMIQSDTVDEELKREFFLKLIKKCIIEAQEELESLKLEKQMVEMHKLNLSKSKISNFNENTPSGSHKLHQHAKQKPLQPFIITRDATQKAVFGMGYPSLPVMSVDEFYQQRVDEGIFPDEEKMAKINRDKAIAAARDPEEVEEEEKETVEQQVENDDPEYIARMRRMDEYKDVVRRGDGNRYNRS